MAFSFAVADAAVIAIAMNSKVSEFIYFQF
jgi:hypothetical protein